MCSVPGCKRPCRELNPLFSPWPGERAGKWFDYASYSAVEKSPHRYGEQEEREMIFSLSGGLLFDQAATCNASCVHTTTQRKKVRGC